MKRPLPESPAALAPIWGLALVALGVGYRVAVPVFDLPWNSAPLMAMAFGGAMLLGVRFWWIPVAALLAGDLALGLMTPGGGIGGYTLMSALFYLAAAWLGAKAGRGPRLWPALWCGTLLCGLLFYVLANTYTWLALPAYAKTFAGWWQSQTTGLPEFSPPAWVFLRNSLLADTAWCVLAGIVHALFARPLPVAVPPAPAH